MLHIRNQVLVAKIREESVEHKRKLCVSCDLMKPKHAKHTNHKEGPPVTAIHYLLYTQCIPLQSQPYPKGELAQISFDRSKVENGLCIQSWFKGHYVMAAKERLGTMG